MAVATEIPASLPPFTVPWYRTLFFRVVVLCAVLLACGSLPTNAPPHVLTNQVPGELVSDRLGDWDCVIIKP